MEKFYSTGEVAKLCQVTTRTVQYYDKNNIVSPSLMSHGGRRLYNEEDIDKIKCVLLYKQLGFSLDEIREIVVQNSTNRLLMFVSQQEEIIKKQLQELKEKENKLHFFKQEISERQKVTINNISELNKIMERRKDFQKKGNIIWVLLIGFQIFLFCCFPIFFKQGGLFPIIMILLTMSFLLFLIYYHSINNAYICPNCHHKFTLSFLKDAFTLNNGKKGKIIKCPKCGIKTTMKETYNE